MQRWGGLAGTQEAARARIDLERYELAGLCYRQRVTSACELKAALRGLPQSRQNGTEYVYALHSKHLQCLAVQFSKCHPSGQLKAQLLLPAALASCAV